MTGPVKYKDPDDILDYQFTGTNWVPSGDSILSYTLTADDGITVYDDSNTDTAVTYWVSGGTAGRNYNVTCHIVTVGGREADKVMQIRVRQARCQE